MAVHDVDVEQVGLGLQPARPPRPGARNQAERMDGAILPVTLATLPLPAAQTEDEHAVRAGVVRSRSAPRPQGRHGDAGGATGVNPGSCSWIRVATSRVSSAVSVQTE